MNLRTVVALINQLFTQYKKYIAYIVLILSLAGFVFIISNYSILNLSLPNNSESYMEKIGEEKHKTSSGIRVMKTGSYKVSSSVGNKKTNSYLVIKPFNILNAKIFTKPQYVSTKMGFNNQSCLIGNRNDFLKYQYYTLDCSNLSSVNKVTYENKTIQTNIQDNNFEQLSLRQMGQFKDGVVGFRLLENGDTTVVYFNGIEMKQIFTTYRFSKFNDEKLKIEINGSSIAILDFDKKEILQSNNGGESFSILSIEKILKSKNPRSVTLKPVDSSVFLYISKPSINNNEQFTEASLYIIKNNEISSNIVLNKSISDSFRNFYPLGSNSIVVNELNGSVVLYTIKNNSVHRESLVANSRSVSVFDNRIFYIDEGDLYEYDKKNNQSYLKFHGDRVFIDKIYNINHSLIIEGYSKSFAEQPDRFTYFINVEKNIGNQKRLEDYLPMLVPSIYSWSIDYRDKIIHIMIPLTSSRKSPSTGETIYNKDELEINLQAINREMKRQGLLKNNFTITYQVY